MMFGQLAKCESLRDLIVALEAHWRKLYHLGMGKSVTRSNLAKANEQRDYRIFEDFAYHLVAEARSKSTEKIFGFDGHVYAFDSTTIDLCLEVFEWAKFRKHKGGIKVHTLYDIEAQVPAFFHITTASMHDIMAMPEIPYEKGAYYIFDRGYNDFANLFNIEQIEATGLRYMVTERANNMAVGSWRSVGGGGIAGDFMRPFTKDFWNRKAARRRARTLEVLRTYGDSITARRKETIIK